MERKRLGEVDKRWKKRGKSERMRVGRRNERRSDSKKRWK